MNTLEKTFSASRSVIASWTSSDFIHFKSFITNWQEHQSLSLSNTNNDKNNVVKKRKYSSKMSLLEYWQSIHRSLVRNIELTENNNQGRGVIVFERNMEVGLIIRANSQLQLEEDTWCIYYPDDVGTATGTADGSTFADFLSALLPQCYSLVDFVQSNDGNSNSNNLRNKRCAITYYCHKNVDLSSPPQRAALNEYRTIGTLDKPYEAILTK